jgi:hypothetical protein
VFVLVALLVGATAGAVAGLIAAAVAFGAGRYVQRQLPAGRGTRPMSAADETRALHGDVRRLGPRDVVAYEGTDYVIDRTMRFDEDGFTWDEHLLDDAVGGRKLWLSVEDDEGLEIIAWERLKGAALEPGPGSLEHAGATYELDERGRANFTSEGVTGAPGGGKAEFADYECGDQRLSFERYGDDSGWEISAGRVISEHALDIYPSRGPNG